MMSVAKQITTVRQLYKHLFRTCEKLPTNVQDHYKHYIRQGFNSHVDEPDPERVTEIIQKSLEDAEWILKKYEKR